MTGEVGRGWVDGGGNGWRQLNWRGGSGEECDHKPMIYNWFVSRSGEEDTGVKKIESIINNNKKNTQTRLTYIPF